MRFVDTIRFSPVAQKVDVPWEEDYFHVPPESITQEIISKSIIDENWWYTQEDRCKNGFEIENAIEPGGDAIVDGIDAIWHGNDVYLPEYDYWIYDRKVKITGRHYFYLNFWKIFGLDHKTGYKTIIPPRFLDMDFLFYLRIDNMIRFKKDDQELKGRQLGFSEKGAGGVIGWNFTFLDGSLNVIVGGVEEDALKTMRDCIRGLNGLINTQFYKERAKGGDSQTYIKAKNTESQIHCLTAKDNPQAVSRFSPTWVWMEEIGKGKKGWSIETAGYIRPSIEAEGGIKTGWINYIGTGGEMEDGVYDLEERHYDPDKYNVLSFSNRFDEQPNKNKVGHFTSKAWFYKSDKEGNSLLEDSKDFLLEERAKLKPKDRFLHTTQYPIYANEVFYTSGGGFMGEEKIQMLNERAAYINNHKDEHKEKRGFLSWKDPKNKNKGVNFTADEEGPFYIFEHPETNQEGEVPLNLYFAGTDSYDQDVAFHTDSLGSCHVWKNFLRADKTYKKWVARIVQRPTEEEGGAERFYENTALLTAYYNARNLIEFSKWRIIDWYTRNGVASLLKERPESILASFITNSKASNRYGIDPSTKKDWINILRETLTKETIDGMDDIEQVRRFAKYRYDPTGKKYNCDVTISSALSLVHQQDEQDYTPVYESDIEKEEEKLSYWKTDAEGNLVHSFHEN